MLEPDHESSMLSKNVQRGRVMQLREDRTAAFGAIRRAVEMRRTNTRLGDMAYASNDLDGANRFWISANAIDSAIRVAIKADPS